MIKRHYLYGTMGLLSFLGFIGIFSNEKDFLLFFAFAVNFEYFFMKSDEMLEEYMNKSASGAFYLGMIVTAVAALLSFFLQEQSGNESLIAGLAWGWAAAVILYSLSTAYYCFKEKWGLDA